jgi:NADH-quinone oxidoreductase subunit K
MENLFLLVYYSLILFLVGLWGVVVIRNNMLSLLVAVELMLFGVSFSFIFFSLFFDDLLGQIFAFFILTIAASESAVGLAILVFYYRLRGLLNIDFINTLKG